MSGKFAANAAWLTLAAISGNLLRAARCLASGFHARARGATIRSDRSTSLPAPPAAAAAASPCTFPNAGTASPDGKACSRPHAARRGHPVPCPRPGKITARPAEAGGGTSRAQSPGKLPLQRSGRKRSTAIRRWIEADPAHSAACPDVQSPDAAPSCSSAPSSGRQPAPSRRAGQDCTKASRSALIVWAWVVGMPCGNPGYVFSVPFCTSRADSGPESA